jgi:hypothetical protein
VRGVRWLACVLLAVPLAACGIPDRTEVVPQGPGPSPGTALSDDSAPQRSGREKSTDPAQFVLNYLEAAAGEPETAMDRVGEFLAPQLKESFKPQQEILVVRFPERPLVNPGSVDVKLKVQQVGVLTSNGVLDPPTSQAAEYVFSVSGQEGRTGLFLTNAPPILMISEDALDQFYERRPIYFWNAPDRNRLVPDLRYLPLEVPSERQPTEIVKWLTKGPSKLLDGAVDPLPDGTVLQGNVPAISNNKLQINLNNQAATVDPTQLGAQLRWSLRPNPATVLEIRIDQRVVGNYGGEAYRTSNQSWRQSDSPEKFCLVEGQVRRLRSSAFPNDPVPLLDEATNRQIRYAAFARAGNTTYGALVVTDGEKTLLRVGSGLPGGPAPFSNVALTTPAGAPVWATKPADGAPGAAVGLIVGGGRLYSFTSDGAAPRLAEWPGAPGGLTAVAAAPDGNRLAVIAGGQLYLAAMSVSGGNVRVNQPRLIGSQMRDLSAVAWGSEGSVVIAGIRRENNRVAVMDITTEGTSKTELLPDLGSTPVSYLATFPANPAGASNDPAAVAYVAENNRAYDVLGSPQSIDLNHVVGPAPSPGSSAQATAPFYLR